MQRIRQFDFLPQQSITNEHNILIIINDVEKKNNEHSNLRKNSKILILSLY